MPMTCCKNSGRSPVASGVASTEVWADVVDPRKPVLLPDANPLGSGTTDGAGLARAAVRATKIQSVGHGPVVPDGNQRAVQGTVCRVSADLTKRWAARGACAVNAPRGRLRP